MIIIASKRKKEENILKKYPNAIIADVTSQAKDGLVKLSPFYPYGDIPVPFSKGYTAACVEGIWQGLKVFEKEDIDICMFSNNTMKNIKRTVRKHGRVLGHRKGVGGTEILSYVEAKHKIYIPAYTNGMLGEQIVDEDLEQFALGAPQNKRNEVLALTVPNACAGCGPVFEIVVDAQGVEKVVEAIVVFSFAFGVLPQRAFGRDVTNEPRAEQIMRKQDVVARFEVEPVAGNGRSHARKRVVGGEQLGVALSVEVQYAPYVLCGDHRRVSE